MENLELPLHDKGNKSFFSSNHINHNSNVSLEDCLPTSLHTTKCFLSQKCHDCCIHREALDQHNIEKEFRKHSTKTALHKKVTNKVAVYCRCSISCLTSILFNTFPVFKWLPKYNYKENLISDIISGFTVSILHIPQGMAYGLLASADAINGLYVSFFPLLIYFMMGTSRHISVGTFAVVSLMLSSTVEKLIVENNKEAIQVLSNNTHNSTLEGTKEIQYWEEPTNLEVLTTVCLVTGGWQLLMGIFHLGTLSVLLSDTLVSGFSTGAAVHVATSQIRDLFDINVGKYGGPFKLLFKFQDIFQNIQHTNIATLLVSAIAIFILAIVKEQINGRYKRKLKMPVPIDLIVVIIATAASHFGNFNNLYKIKIMGNIPTGLPHPVIPRMDLVPKVVPDSLTIALVAFAITMSMAKIFEKKYKYDIDPNQELLALGSANIFSSFFLCYPCATSMSRSLVQERAGGKTQLAALVSCCILLVVMLALGPLFYTLPKCILSCIILVALKGMFLQVTDLKKAWKISITDATIWLVTFLSVVLIDVDYGLILGVIFSIFTVFIRSIIPYQALLGSLPQTNLYLDLKLYGEAQELPGLKIFHYGTALNFVNRETFRSVLLGHAFPEQREKLQNGSTKPTLLLRRQEVQCVIIKCSSISYIDSAGIETLTEIIEDFKEKGISLLLASCSVPVIDMLQKTGFLSKASHPCLFPTVHDAVLYFKSISHKRNGN